MIPMIVANPIFSWFFLFRFHVDACEGHCWWVLWPSGHGCSEMVAGRPMKAHGHDRRTCGRSASGALSSAVTIVRRDWPPPGLNIEPLAVPTPHVAG